MVVVSVVSGFSRTQRVADGNTLEKRRQMLQAQTRGNLIDAHFARRAMERCHLAQIRQRLARTSGPRDAAQSLHRSAHRQPVPHDTEREIVRNDVRPREQHERGRRDQQYAVDHEPHPVPFVIALERSVDQCQRLFEREVLGMGGDDRRLMPEIPQ
jgi:hypothetical protein